MRLILAPMEGVIDHNMRALLTRLGGFDRCVTEFVRVTDLLLPPRVFHRLCPELEQGGVTPSGTPVFLQLLGSRPDVMAKNAARAVQLGAPGIDLNFGCPAKTVNRHGGGSVLLQTPSKIREIVHAVRDHVDPAIPVTVKIRLGYSDASRLQEITDGIASAGATELSIHARTRQDGYQPPAYWHHIGELQHPHGMNIIANGEIWSPSDARKARIQGRCDDLMLGRGSLARPDLAVQLQAHEQGHGYRPLDWNAVCRMVETVFLDHDSSSPRHTGNRTKQWLVYLRRQYPGAGLLFQQIRTLRSRQEISAAIRLHSNSLRIDPVRAVA